MPEYLAPAVFVEETSFRAKSIEGVGTSTAAFVGMTARGPTASEDTDPTPPLLTSFTDFERYFGGTDDLSIGGNAVPNYLAHAARAFFNNGGGRLYVARVLGNTAARAGSGQLQLGTAVTANKKVAFMARQPGGVKIPGTSNNYAVLVAQMELPTTKRLALTQPVGTMIRIANEFYVLGLDPVLTTAGNLTAFTSLALDGDCAIVSFAVEVHDGTGLVHEAAGLGLHPRHPRYIGTLLGAAPPNPSDAMTNPVQLDVGANVTAFELRAALVDLTDDQLADLTSLPLADAAALKTKPGDLSAVLKGKPVVRSLDLDGGSDGTGTPATADIQSALDRLLALEDISIVAAPGSASYSGSDPAAINQMLIGHAEARRSYRIAVLDTPANLDIAGVRALKSKIDSKYAALYYPWIRLTNPGAALDPLASKEIDVPPSGAVCGIYARNDVQRGVWKAPANETVTGALGLQRDVRFGEQEVLNPLGINCIRALPGRGIRVWGARTLSSDPEWKYVNIRRYFLYLESSIDRGTQWAVFEPNGEALWANVRSTISDFLYNEWVSGALLGTKPEEAFFVRCDRSTMTQNDLDNGRLICLVGVAAIKPAEFVIFRIGQKTADARG
ncbi:phage tail sheath subtilisin-like domain-containing protein [Novosphingobium sp.]|uniref:phage tail sheath subtilisin-like domain-containing protein n=1 Tax=Novosphingobium sp. TaxID=1874826 RepID=UPI00286A1D53|nr:phage tail sheath subtilisin-like domain-containing protein [Novosphingobium sp.]